MKNCPKCNSEHTKDGVFCSRICANSRVFSEDAIRKKKESNKSWAKKNSDIAKSNITRANKARIAKSIPTRYCSICNKRITKDNKSGLCKQHFEDSDKKSEYVARRKKYVRRKVYNVWQESDVWLLSSLEIKFYEKLEENRIKWFKPNKIVYKTDDGISHRYFSDFYLPDEDRYIEIKGYYWPSDRVKMDLVMKQNPELKIEVLFEKDIEQWC